MNIYNWILAAASPCSDEYHSLFIWPLHILPYPASITAACELDMMMVIIILLSTEKEKREIQCFFQLKPIVYFKGKLGVLKLGVDVSFCQQIY